MFPKKSHLILYAACILFSFSCAATPSVFHLNRILQAGKSIVDVEADGVAEEPELKEPISPKKIWAVLVAGSYEFFNYRHQADVCHAYQLLIRNGVPANQIIVMMYDDIAFNPENPTPGVIINRPNGTNVYEGLVIDYRKKDVTPENFIKVLLGDKEAMKGVGSGRVLESGPDDHVFINFVDHGAPGLVAFPTEELHAKDLESTLHKMYEMKKYAKMVFYMEACESGSMFQRLLPPHMEVFATTAANGNESSWACYFDERLETYLGDVYSVNWMENADQTNLKRETLQSQFLIVKNETSTSHVMEFGDRRLRDLPVADFLGYSATPLTLPKVQLDAVRSEDVVPTILQWKLARTQNKEERRELKSQLRRLYKMRKLVTFQMTAIIEAVTGHGHTANLTSSSEEELEKNSNSQVHELLHNHRLDLTNFDCYERVTKYFSKNCFSIAKNPYVTRKLYLLVNMCELGISSEKIVSAMTNTCHHKDVVGIH